MTLLLPFEIDQDFIDYNKFRYYEIFVPNDDKVFKSSAKILCSSNSTFELCEKVCNAVYNSSRLKFESIELLFHHAGQDDTINAKYFDTLGEAGIDSSKYLEKDGRPLFGKLELILKISGSNVMSTTGNIIGIKQLRIYEILEELFNSNRYDYKYNIFVSSQSNIKDIRFLCTSYARGSSDLSTPSCFNSFLENLGETFDSFLFGKDILKSTFYNNFLKYKQFSMTLPELIIKTKSGRYYFFVLSTDMSKVKQFVSYF